jgi:hypothetical protein
MRHFAAMDPLIALLVGIGWIVVKVLQAKKKDADSWGDLNEQPPAPKPHVPSRGIGGPPRKIETPGRTAMPPLAPRSSPRSVQRKTTALPTPPPIAQTAAKPRTTSTSQVHPQTSVELAALKESQELYARTQQLDKAIASRLAAIEQETTSAKATPIQPRARSAASAHILRTMRHRATARQGILASLVLNPPKALE